MPNYLDEAHRAEIVKLSTTVTSKTEWPTWVLLVGFYLAWAFIVFCGEVLGDVFAIALLVPLVVLWMSIQHELIHGHPTRWPAINKALGFLPFAVWYPYDIYRDTHLAHHNDEVLTVPGQDPESRYVTGAFWLCSPRYSAISAIQYVFLVSLPALSIAMIRSFYEHRPSTLPEHRTVINESSGLLSWLFLNLNLHLVHHDLPGVPWFYLPRVFRARRERWIALAILPSNKNMKANLGVGK